MVVTTGDVEGGGVGVWGMIEESQMEDEGKLCLKGDFMVKTRRKFEDKWKDGGIDEQQMVRPNCRCAQEGPLSSKHSAKLFSE